MVSINETLDQALNLDAADSWSLGEKSFAEIVGLLKDLDPKRILEFGSGVSSVRFALRLPDCEITSVEHDRFYADKTESLKNTYHASNLKLIYSPLNSRWFGLTPYRTYSFKPEPIEFDGIIIDGPPGAVKGGREACLYFVYQHLKIGGFVFLDDYERSEEQRAIRHWLETYADSFEFFEIQGRHRVAVLRKMQHVKPKMMTAARIGHNFRCQFGKFIAGKKGCL